MIYSTPEPAHTPEPKPHETVTLRVDGRVVAVPKGRLVVGRSRECDLQVEDGNVSRRHFELVRSGGDWTVADLGSTNGTELNGRTITRPTPVDDGDRIRIGSTELVFGRTHT